MLVGQIIIIAVVAVALIATYIVLKHRGIAIPDKAYKIVSGVLAVAFFFRYMWDRDNFLNIVELGNSSIDSKALTAMALLLNWFIISVLLLVLVNSVWQNNRAKSIIRCFGGCVVLLYLATLQNNTICMLGGNAYNGFNIRIIFLSIELSILTAIIVIEFLEHYKLFGGRSTPSVDKAECSTEQIVDTQQHEDNQPIAVSVNSSSRLSVSYNWWQNILLCVGLVVCMLLATMPSYMFMALFGYSKQAQYIIDLSLTHRLIIYLGIVLPIVLYILLKGREAKTIRYLLIYLTLGTVVSFSVVNKFVDLTRLADLPLHLCNTAMYVIPLCLIFRLKKVFYFTYFINVLGASIAILMPSYADASNLFSYSVVAFFTNHYIAFFMPILIVALGVYERPKVREFRYSMIGFAIYFVLILGINAYCTNYKESVDFFFLNSDFVATKLGDWAEDTRDIIFQFSIGELKFVFYPLYQAIFFLVYVAAGAGMWFLYEAMYGFEDSILDILDRKKKIKADRLALEVSLAGRTKEEPMNIDIADKVVLNNFSKRYGTSSNYAVKDANLEVCAGDIFGFLGHNGAGKSTIIKSIVGIQPITSGAISVCGYDVDKQSVMAKRCIGFVPDHYALYEKLTGREYLNYIADLYQVSKADRDDSIKYFVNLFHLEGAIDNQIKTYSHGMKQKVTIMSALVHNPKLWILDEPLTGLDPDSIMQVKKCMRDHADKGNIVFFSSHLIDVVENVCTKIAIIAKGNVLVQGELSDLVDGDGLENYYRKVTEGATSNKVDDAGNLVAKAGA